MERPLRVVLVSPRNPLNIGAVARAMSNFGFTDLRLVNPYQVAFEEARSAVRARYILESARQFDTVASAVADAGLVVGTTAGGRRDLHVPCYRLERAAALIRQKAAPAVALLFGSEKFGLSNQDLSHCHWVLRIPTRAEHGSMNLGQAAAICFYELKRESDALPAAPYPLPEEAPAGVLDQMTELLIELLDKSGYIEERTHVSAELKVRRLVRRMHWPAHDAHVWLGMLRQVLWKVRQGSIHVRNGD